MSQRLLPDSPHRPDGLRQGEFDSFEDRLDVAEAEAEVLELADPADADERFGTVEAIPPFRAGHRLQ